MAAGWLEHARHQDHPEGGQDQRGVTDRAQHVHRQGRAARKEIDRYQRRRQDGELVAKRNPLAAAIQAADRAGQVHPGCPLPGVASSSIEVAAGTSTRLLAHPPGLALGGPRSSG